jgi:hypothetical protein
MPFTRIILAVLSFCLGIYCLLSAVEIARVTVIPFIIPFIGNAYPGEVADWVWNTGSVLLCHSLDTFAIAAFGIGFIGVARYVLVSKQRPGC